MKLVTAAEMRLLEAAAISSGTGVPELMERAGLGVAEAVKSFLGGVVGRRLLVLIGPGNNGGDGLVAARHLHRWGAKVFLYLCPSRSPQDASFSLVQHLPWSSGEDDPHQAALEAALSRAEAVVDALFGTGKTRPLEGAFREMLLRVNQARQSRPGLRLIALDLPSGLNPDTGEVDPATPQADLTVTLGFPKRGLFTFPGTARVGRVEVVDIGLPAGQDIATEVITHAYVRACLPPRPGDAHKGSFGRLLVVAGSANYIGAASLACMGAYRVGAGLVTLASARSLHPILAMKLTEATHLPLPEAEPGSLSPAAAEVLWEEIPRYDVLLTGCGLGQRPGTEQFLSSLLPLLGQQPCLWDADALNLLSRLPGWWQRLPPGGILTPHPAEFSRLSGLPVEQVQAERLEITRRLAQHWGQVVVLKGAHTVVAAPEGEVRLSPFANPGLASAGTGDVLAGAIAGLLAQRLSPFDAAACGVYLHGLAGEKAKEEMGEAGMVASDLLPALPQAIKQLQEKTDGH